ncbi:hypothetical protein ACH3XW_24485 [Acanthocheilonema viteae]
MGSNSQLSNESLICYTNCNRNVRNNTNQIYHYYNYQSSFSSLGHYHTEKLEFEKKNCEDRNPCIRSYHFYHMFYRIENIS